MKVTELVAFIGPRLKSGAWLKKKNIQNIHPGNHYLLKLHFRPPYSWGGLSFLTAHATPGVEVFEDGKYRRTIS